MKQAAARAERALERLAEPLSALLSRPSTGRRRSSTQAWVEVLRNSAHDSICACSVDEVCDAVLHRYAEATQIADGLADRALRALGATIAATAPVVVNPSARARGGLVELRLPGAAAPPGCQLVSRAAGRAGAHGRHPGARSPRSPWPSSSTCAASCRSPSRRSTACELLHVEREDGGHARHPAGAGRAGTASASQLRRPGRARARDEPPGRHGAGPRRRRARLRLAGLDRARAPRSSRWRPGRCACRNGLVDVQVDPTDGTFVDQRPRRARRARRRRRRGRHLQLVPARRRHARRPSRRAALPARRARAAAGPPRDPQHLRPAHPRRRTGAASAPSTVTCAPRSSCGPARTSSGCASSSTTTASATTACASTSRSPTRRRPHGPSARSRSWSAASPPRAGPPSSGCPPSRPAASCRPAGSPSPTRACSSTSWSTCATGPTARRRQHARRHAAALHRDAVAGPDGHPSRCRPGRSRRWRARSSRAACPSRFALHVGDRDPYAVVDDAFLPLLVTQAGGGQRCPPTARRCRSRAPRCPRSCGRAARSTCACSTPPTSPATVRIDGRPGWLVDLRGRPLEPFEGSFDARPRGHRHRRAHRLSRVDGAVLAAGSSRAWRVFSRTTSRICARRSSIASRIVDGAPSARRTPTASPARCA